MTDNIKLPPMPKPHTPPVFATAANTQSVKAGYELGGYEKTPPLFDEHQLEAYAREAVRLNAQGVPAAAPAPRKIEMPPPGADALDVAFAEGWNQCCDAYFGGLPPQAPLVVTVFKTNSDTAEAAPQHAQQPLADAKEALDLLNAENARLTKLVVAYRGPRNHHNLAEKLSDMMTFAGCSLSEYQQAVLAAGLRALLEPRTEDTQ